MEMKSPEAPQIKHLIPWINVFIQFCLGLFTVLLNEKYTRDIVVTVQNIQSEWSTQWHSCGEHAVEQRSKTHKNVYQFPMYYVHINYLAGFVFKYIALRNSQKGFEL